MTISGLSNNYYLAGNSIWVEVSAFVKTPVSMELTLSNSTSGKTLPPFTLYPSPDEAFRFNVCLPIRALQPEPDHISYNSLQAYSIVFSVTFDDGTTESLTLAKYFVRGGRNKEGNAEWYLNDGDKLFNGKYPVWHGIDLPGFAQWLQGAYIIDYAPTPEETHKLFLHTCNYKILKFLNSLGGYQYWVFESWQVKSQAKPRKGISRISQRLRNDTFRALGTEEEQVIILKTKTPIELQHVILELIQSQDVLLYDPAGTDDLSRWNRVQLAGSSDAILNNYDRTYQNEFTYSLPNYINRDL